jgi:hypothetical protein
VVGGVTAFAVYAFRVVSKVAERINEYNDRPYAAVIGHES